MGLYDSVYHFLENHYKTSATKSSAISYLRCVLPDCKSTLIKRDILLYHHAALCCPTVRGFPLTAPHHNLVTLT